MILCNWEISAARKPSYSNATKASSKTLSFSSTTGKGKVAFNSRANHLRQKGLTAGAVLVIGALEDDHDNDDTATGNCGWVLSFKDKPKLNGLVFKPAATTKAPLRALTRARAKTGTEEDAANTAAQEFSKTIVASFRNTKEPALPFAGEVVVEIVVATARCAWVATTRIQSRK
jgi:hypothetical protein